MDRVPRNARSAGTYASWLTDAGFAVFTVEAHGEAVSEMVRNIGTRPFAVDVLAGVKDDRSRGCEPRDGDAHDEPGARRSGAQADRYAILCAAI